MSLKGKWVVYHDPMYLPVKGLNMSYLETSDEETLDYLIQTYGEDSNRVRIFREAQEEKRKIEDAKREELRKIEVRRNKRSNFFRTVKLLPALPLLAAVFIVISPIVAAGLSIEAWRDWLNKGWKYTY